ncbi:hypothetical protein ACPW96_02790 [Micromonospora sp. DT81.3]|uniref:baeRF2 domain-containing protein n=1 Tax=Micromonospora sp. DT81.3 TaxID=3416523 RepID=UPI003CF8B763
MDNTTDYLRTLADVYREPEPVSCVYVDMSVDTADPPQVERARSHSAVDALRRAGAPDADIEAVVEALTEAEGVPSPVTVFSVVRGGEALLTEVIRSTPADAESVSFGRVPDLSPAVKHALTAFSYLVVETAREGGRVTLFQVGKAAPETSEYVEGRTDSLHKPKRGAGSRNEHTQDHVEEIWKQTQSEVATTIDHLVRRHRPRLLVVAGDIRARQLLADELSHEAKAILVVEPTDTEPEGASDERLTERIDAEIERIVRADEEAITDLINLHEGRGDNLAELTVGGVVHALASAQVDALLIDDARLADRELLALDDAPWVASTPEDALTARILGRVPARSALLRAALLTDARVYFTREAGLDDHPLTLPGEAAVAALLRWQTGPAVPAAS